MAQRFLRRLDSNRFDIPEIHNWSIQLAAQGNFRDCDVKGQLIKPGPQPWVDQNNGIHKPGSREFMETVGMDQGETVKIPAQNLGSIIYANGIPCHHWIPNYILEEVGTQENAVEVMMAELELVKCKTPTPVRVFKNLLRIYKEARRLAYTQAGRQDPDITEPMMLARFYELHPNLVKKDKAAVMAQIASAGRTPTDEEIVKAKKKKFRRGRRMKKGHTMRKKAESSKTNPEPVKETEPANGAV